MNKENIVKDYQDYKKVYDSIEDKNSNAALQIMGAMSALEHLCPELAESEDEKIRKDIISLVIKWWKDDGAVESEFSTQNSMLAWLEKQCEPIEINPSEFDLQLNRLLKQFETLPKEELASILSFYLNVLQNDGTYKDGKQGEKNPVDKIQIGKKYKCIASPRYTTFVKGSIYKPEDKFICSLMNYCSDCFEPIEDVEPKFKVGDKIRRKTPSSCDKDMQVARIENDYYVCNYIGKFSSEVVPFSKESSYELIEQKPSDKVEPKFHEGDWVIDKQGIAHQISNVIENVTNHTYGYDIVCGGYFNDKTEGVRLWTIQDAKKGDVLEFGDHGRLVVGIVSYVNKTTGKVDVNYLLENSNFKVGNYYNLDTIKPHPATKEQRDALMKAMTDAGYTCNFESKGLKEIVVPIFNIGNTIIKKHNSNINDFGSFTITNITGGKYWYKDRIICDITKQDEWELYEPVRQKSAEWSEEDERMFKVLREGFNILGKDEEWYSGITNGQILAWLKSFEERIQLQNSWKPSEEMLEALYRVIQENVMEKSEDEMLLDKLYQGLKYGKVLSEK